MELGEELSKKAKVNFDYHSIIKHRFEMSIFYRWWLKFRHTVHMWLSQFLDFPVFCCCPALFSHAQSHGKLIKMHDESINFFAKNNNHL